MDLQLPDEETMLELARRRSGGHPVGEEIGQRDLTIQRDSAVEVERAAVEAAEQAAKAEVEAAKHEEVVQACPICGLETPHTHTAEEIEEFELKKAEHGNP